MIALEYNVTLKRLSESDKHPLEVEPDPSKVGDKENFTKRCPV